MKRSAWVLVATLTMCLPALAGGTVAEKKGLTIEGARHVMQAATAHAASVKASGSIAIVDEAGTLLCFERLDGTFAAGAKVSIGKARTSAIFKKPTRDFEKTIADGRTAMVALEDFTPLQGGVPIVVEGQVVGAIGVSGAASAQQDEEIAMAGAAAVTKATASASE